MMCKLSPLAFTEFPNTSLQPISHKECANTYHCGQDAYVLAKLLQSCLTLCDPMDCSPPGSCPWGFSRQEYLRGLPIPSPGIEPRSPALLTDSLPSESPAGKPKNTGVGRLSFLQGNFSTQELNQGLLQWQAGRFLTTSTSWEAPSRLWLLLYWGLSLCSPYLESTSLPLSYPIPLCSLINSLQKVFTNLNSSGPFLQVPTVQPVLFHVALPERPASVCICIMLNL